MFSQSSQPQLAATADDLSPKMPDHGFVWLAITSKQIDYCELVICAGYLEEVFLPDKRCGQPFWLARRGDTQASVLFNKDSLKKSELPGRNNERVRSLHPAGNRERQNDSRDQP